MFGSIIELLKVLFGLGAKVVNEAEDYRRVSTALTSETDKALATAQALAAKQREQLAKAKLMRADAEQLVADIDAIDARVRALKEAQNGN